MIVVGVTGHKRCGKNATADILVKRFGFKQYGFADALRTMALAVDPTIDLRETPRELLDEMLRWGQYHTADGRFRYSDAIQVLGYERAKEIPDVRRFLQLLGTEGVRGTFGPQAWVNALDHRIKQEQPERVVISDVRFKSEAHWVNSQGGEVWRVIRPGFGSNDLHPSETEMRQIRAHVEIVAHSLEELEKHVVHFADMLLDHPFPEV